MAMKHGIGVARRYAGRCLSTTGREGALTVFEYQILIAKSFRLSQDFRIHRWFGRDFGIINLERAVIERL